MPAINPSFLVNVETRMEIIQENEFARLSQNLWWDQVARKRNTNAAKDVIQWLLSTATIRDQDGGGNITFEDLVSNTTEITTSFSGAGLKLRKSQLQDSDGGGLKLAADWAAQMGAQMAYWPQKKVVHFLKNGHTAASSGGYDSYDAVPYFSQSHPLNPYRTAAGTYSNLLTGAASGSYPGACPIDDSVTVDVALTNLSKIFSYVASIKMPNGEDPRYLRPKAILCSPRMFPRAVQLTSAKTIAQAAATGGGGADVEALIKSLGFATPIMADELAGFESDTTFFVLLESIVDTQLGGAVYTEREAFYMGTYGEQTESWLSRTQEFEWHIHGRNSITAGHPYAIIKVKAA